MYTHNDSTPVSQRENIFEISKSEDFFNLMGQGLYAGKVAAVAGIGYGIGRAIGETIKL